MRHYEIILMIHPDKSEIVSNMIDQYKNVILINNKGIIHRVEDWGRRSLAYPIKKLYKAHYVLLNIEVSCKTIFELESLFKFNDDIIRNMIIRRKKAVTDLSPIMQIKDEPIDIVSDRVNYYNKTKLNI
ncbi:30S ribosomal protein S6 [Blochmannia endosymbiont of Camponotus (Colobopsis) obliquus]|uniref:30S ribosomal protein S6 n=1 Tax=Blochmannia endosymbiont of Camponotus (Colobopsis) obliquus TaxID=1505597 RepID=UPI00061A5F06|nr:30S ribosomal protein S6 [Blochmannia endosymbiont of Camponotus (Colobopsis) obliquus]AKC60264.1 30S ribosomal protein S6 [Blochmannia endosymbiont of Camponotus (Colobopsis) obliquus]